MNEWLKEEIEKCTQINNIGLRYYTIDDLNEILNKMKCKNCEWSEEKCITSDDAYCELFNPISEKF